MSKQKLDLKICVPTRKTNYLVNPIIAFSVILKIGKDFAKVVKSYTRNVGLVIASKQAIAWVEKVLEILPVNGRSSNLSQLDYMIIVGYFQLKYPLL